jgi:hypothetical protein
MLQVVMLRAAALLVPRAERSEWLAEWKSELWYVQKEDRREAIAFCRGAFSDALWLRHDLVALDVNSFLHSRSPLRCITMLAVLASAGFCAARYAIWVRGGDPLMKGHPILPHLLLVFYALLVLPVVTSVDFGEYPTSQHTHSWSVRRWLFFATKLVFLLSIGAGATLILLAIGAAPILGPIMMMGYVFAFRWALTDQRRRCPVCLHVLINPVRIGQPSCMFLAWHGTELICDKGHGVLPVPETPTSCYGTHRWFDLDIGSEDALALPSRKP